MVDDNTSKKVAFKFVILLGLVGLLADANCFFGHNSYGFDPISYCDKENS